jgi:3-oxoacyl-[acyl-carrier protein] reductase
VKPKEPFIETMPSSKQLEGMTALVTGASNGIGAETAVALAREGAVIIAHYHSARQNAAAVLERVRAAGGTGELIQADLSERAGVEQLIAAVGGRAIDLLVNNAGSLIRRTKILDLDWDLWDRTMMLNLTSAFFLSRAVLPGMIERKRGAIVNVGSVAGRVGGGIGASAYAAAKGALTTLTHALAKEFAPLGVRVNGVSPGTIDTNYHRQFSNEAMLAGVRAATPLGRLGTAAEVAEVILFLCSPAASFIHGQMIEVNGGFYMH